jgi:glycosyltransferase involved in cell wall biosynthesis
MVFVSLSYNYSQAFKSPESWFKRTEGYAGVLEHISKNNTVINVKQIDYEGECVFKGVDYRFVNFKKRKTYFPWGLNHFVKSLNPDVVLLQGLHHPLQLIQLRFLLNKKTKIIAQHHAEIPFAGAKKIIQRIADRYIDAYLFASRLLGMQWVKKGNIRSPRKIHEVMEVSSLFYPVDKEIAKQKTAVTGEDVFLWVGRLKTFKDPLNVVKAFLRFSLDFQSVKLYMIFHTDELLAEVEQILSEHPNRKSVEIIGQVPHDDLLYWFNSADFVVSGSHYEGSGTAMCEGMSCGCIPILTDIFSFRSMTDNGNCGILYEPGNEEALYYALRLSQKIDMEQKRRETLHQFKTNLSFEAIAGRIQAITASL